MHPPNFPEASADKHIARGLMGLSQQQRPDEPALFHLVATVAAMEQLGLAAYVAVRRMMMDHDQQGTVSFLYAQALVLSDGVPFDLDDNVDWLAIANARIDDEEAPQGFYFENQFVDRQGSLNLIQEQMDMELIDYPAAVASGAALVSAHRGQQLDQALLPSTVAVAPKPRM